MKRRFHPTGRQLRLIVGIAFSLLFLYFALRKIEWTQLWESLLDANYLYLIPGLLLLIAINWVRAYRWRLLMHPDTHLPLTRIFRIVNIGYFFNNILPAKAGEVVRGYLIGNMLSGGIGQALSTLLIERLLDVLAVVVFLLILIPSVNLPAQATQGALLFGAVAIGGTIVLLVLSRFGGRGVDWVWRFVGRIPLIGHPKVEAATRNLIEGLGVLTIGKLLPGILVGSVLIWVGYALFNYVILLAFDELAHLPFSAVVFVLCATGLSMIVPSSPGAIGVFEWAAIQALLFYGVSQDLAAGYAFVLHIFTLVSMIIFGLIGLVREGLSYAQVRREVRADAEMSFKATTSLEASAPQGTTASTES